jgi:hypothetical protein
LPTVESVGRRKRTPRGLSVSTSVRAGRCVCDWASVESLEFSRREVTLLGRSLPVHLTPCLEGSDRASARRAS